MWAKDCLVRILAIIGCVAVFTFLGAVIAILIDTIKDVIRNKRYEYKRKHRFDGPPLAKCYCKDCKYWGYQGQCMRRKDGKYTADCWFCWEAEPREKDPDLEEDVK